MLDFESRTVNADLFFAEVQRCFEEYCKQLERCAWESDVWGKFRSRMHDLIRNCEIPDHDRKKQKR
jgi:hypothetical protein